MLREYQRELNDSIWPRGITPHKEAHFYTAPLLSALILIYLLAKFPFNLDLLWNMPCIERKWGNRGKTQIRAEKLQLKTPPQDNPDGNWWTAVINVKTKPILRFPPDTQRKRNILTFHLINMQDKRRQEYSNINLKQKWAINSASVCSALF